MSKAKKGKEGVKGAGATGGQKWDEALVLEQLETENWRACVAVVSGEDHSSEEMVSSLVRHITAPTADSKQRRRFYALSHQEVLKKALEAGGSGPVSKSQASKGKGKGAPSPGGVLGGKPPGAEALAELVKSQSVSEDGPGPDTLARAVKMSLLVLRQEDMMRRQNEGGSRPRSGAGSPSKKGDKKGEKATPTAKGKAGGKGGKTVEEGIPMPSKPESTMKKRGEDVGETVFVDDEPVHGPDAYVLLCGVRAPEVLAEMGRVGVAPSCVVRARGTLGAQGGEGEVEEGEIERRNKIGDKLREFWKGVELVLEGSKDSGTRDTGLIQFEYTAEGVKEGEGVEGLYDTLASHIYTLVEQKRQHKQYLECLSLADLSGGSAAKREKSDGLYRELLAPLPSQSRPVSLLVESMLQQVCAGDLPPRIPVEKGVPMSLAMQESLNRIRRRADLGSPSGETTVKKTASYPVIYEGDKIRERESLLDRPTTSQHRGLDRRGVEKRILESFYAAQLVKRFPSLDQDERCRVNARYQQLLRIARQSEHPLTPHEVQNSLLRLAVAEMLDTQSSHLFDDPYPSQDRQVSIARLKPFLSRIQWSELLTRDVIAQRIQEALAPDKTCHLRYHKQSDSLILYISSHSGSEQWGQRILTPAGFYLYQRFLHAELSPLVQQLSRMNSAERERLLSQQDLTPNPSQVSLTQLPAKEGRTSSHAKVSTRASRSSRLKESRTSTPVSALMAPPESVGSREDLLSVQRSEAEQKSLFLSGYDVRDDWYAGKGESDKIQLSSEAFIRCEQRCFYSSPLSSVCVQYCHSSGLSAGIILLMEKSPLHKPAHADTRDATESEDDDVIAPVTLRDPPPGMAYGSYRVSLPSGVQATLSPYGKLGGLPPPRDLTEDSEIRHLEEDLERSTPHSLPPATSESKVGGKGGGRGKKGEEQQALEQQRQLTEERERRRREIDRLREEKLLRYRRSNKYQSLFLSTPYGLQVTCATKVELSSDATARDGSDGILRVTQSYPDAPSPTQSCDQLRLEPACREASRSCLEDGTVIKLMKDTSVQVLWPDGSCARSLVAGELEKLNRKVPDISDLTSDSQYKSLQTLSLLANHPPGSAEFSLADKPWLYTDREGQRVVYKWVQETEERADSSEDVGAKEGEEEQATTPDKEPVSKFTPQTYGEPLLKSWQVDPVSEEEMVTREDQLTSVVRKDGTRIVQFSDGTRITSSDTSPVILTECPGYAKVRFSTPTPGQATITLFGDNEVVSHRSGEHSLSSGGVTCHFTPDGLLSVIPNEVCQLHLDLVGGGEWMRVSNSSQEYAIDKQFRTLPEQEREVKSEDRIFALTRDGSGMELLSKEGAELELERWRGTKGLLVQSHALPGSSDTIIHSAISPVTTPPREISHLPYTEENIVPTHIRAQCVFPVKVEKNKIDKKVFGSGVGRGLSIGAPERNKRGVKLPPRAFWRRELIEDRPISEHTLSHLVNSLEALNKCWEGTRADREQSVPVDTRAESVREETNSLLQQFRCLQLEGREDLLVEAYEERVRTPPSADRGHAPSERRPEKAEQEKREREEFKANMAALRNRDIPGYFESEGGLSFLQRTAPAPPDMVQLTEQLPLAMKRGQLRGVEASKVVPSPPPATEKLMLPRLSELSQDTDGLAQGYASTTILLPENSGSTVSLTARDRPNNPSPRVPVSTEPSACASEASPDVQGAPRPDNPVAMEADSNPIPEYLFYNVAGVPRTAPVKLPTSIKTLRPGDRESERIDDTKKQPNTASLSMPLSKSLKQGVSLQQTELDFGLLKEGHTYSATVHVKNIGITSTRYKIKPPPPCTGLRTHYTPHPIAAGMSAAFQLEIYAVPVGVVGERGRGRVEHELEIISEVNTLSLPITATVLTVMSYEEEVGELALARGVTMVPVTPSSREGFRGVKK